MQNKQIAELVLKLGAAILDKMSSNPKAMEDAAMKMLLRNLAYIISDMAVWENFTNEELQSKHESLKAMAVNIDDKSF